MWPKKNISIKEESLLKPINYYFLNFLAKVENKETTPKVAIQQLGITKTKYYRLKNEF